MVREFLVLDPEGGTLLHGHGPNFGIAPVAQWIRRLPTEQEILGSIPGGGSQHPHESCFFYFAIPTGSICFDSV